MDILSLYFKRTGLPTGYNARTSRSANNRWTSRAALSPPTPSAFSFMPSPIILATSCPEPIKDWSLTSLKEKLIKTAAKIISHGRYVAFQMAEVAISENSLCRRG